MNVIKSIKKLEKKTNKKVYITSNRKNMKIIGITGSRGKSTTAYLVHQYLKSKGYKSALYSSIMIDSPKSKFRNYRAVENPIYDGYMLLDAIKSSLNNNCDYLILEVNERAISQNIIDDIEFDVKLLTNIIPKQNELYEDYVSLKKSFITKQDNAKKIIAVVDNDTRELYHNNSDIISVCTKHLKDTKMNSEDRIDYLLMASDKQYSSINGLDFIIKDNKKNYKLKIQSNLCMPFHGLNIICAYAVLNELNVDLNTFDEFVRTFNIPGREETVQVGSNKIVISPNMVPHLENLKNYQNRHEIENIYVVLGATGYGFNTWDQDFFSDKYKSIHEYDIKYAYDYAIKNADKIFITLSDNGTDNYQGLIEYQVSLAKGKIDYEVIPNRELALRTAIKQLKENDVLFVSGRGNREVMCINKNRIAKFLDREIIEKIVKGDHHV